MRTRILRIVGCGSLLIGLMAATAQADVCLAVDESRDTFSPSDRTAALLLLAKQFELAAERVVPPPCEKRYVVSHVQLGETISVTLVGPAGRRDATAIGLNDIPAVYN